MIKTSTWSTVRKIKNQGNKELVNLTVKSIIIDKETICSWSVHLTLRNQKHKLNPVEESNKESSCQIKKSRRNRSNQIISNLQSKLRRWEENLSLSRGLSLCVSTMTKLRNWKWKRGREVEEKKKEKWFGFGLMCGGEKRPIMSREIFVFFNFEKTNKRERILFFFFFSFFCLGGKSDFHKGSFHYWIITLLPLKGDFFASSNSRHRGQTVIWLL